MIDMAKLQLLGVGRQAEVYAVSDDECIKLFYPNCSRSEVESEAMRMRFVSESDVSAPRYIGLDEADGRLGIRMERLHGITLLHDALENFNPEIDYGGVLGTLQKSYHQVCAEGLPDMVSSIEWQINRADVLSADEKAEMIKRLKRMPRGDRLVHMDYHSDNVIVTHDGYRVIDWNGAAAGNPLADAARTLLTLELRSYPPNIDDSVYEWIDSTRAACREGYLRAYGADMDALNAWKPIIAAARIFCAPEEERMQDIELVHECLNNQACY